MLENSGAALDVYVQYCGCGPFPTYTLQSKPKKEITITAVRPFNCEQELLGSAGCRDPRTANITMRRQNTHALPGARLSSFE